jgi:hypothetical protein
MEMPSSCDNCELCTCYVREDGTEENYRCVITFYPIHEFDERHEYCPLVEIPPHGRLIDADAPIPLVDTRGKNIEVTIAHIIEENFGVVNAIIEAEEGERCMKN